MNTEYRAYLDNGMDRRGTNCLKWDDLEHTFGRDDVLPMWVADMDFPTLPKIGRAIAQRAAHPIFGYTFVSQEERMAEVAWLKRRHALEIAPEWILYCDGVVDSLYACVRAFAPDGTKIMIQPPVYGPFFQAAKVNDHPIWRNCLHETAEGWTMDLSDMEEGFRSGVSVLLLCNPHNPVGRVWRREELLQVIELADAYHVTVVADEIHGDFAFPPHQAISILSLPHPERRVMLHSATKAFNLAALRQSTMVAPGEEIRSALESELNKMHAGTPNLFGAIAQRVAYEQGDAWLDAVVAYIGENRDYLRAELQKRLPLIRMSDMQGTYLAWLNFRAYALSHDELRRKLIHEARLGLNDGLQFGEEGNGCFRMNLATTRRNLTEAVNRLESVFGSRKMNISAC